MSARARLAAALAYMQASPGERDTILPVPPIPKPSDDDGGSGTSGAPAVRDARLQPRSRVERRPARTRRET